MKKILVVLTGGTIGSRIEGKTIDVTDGSAYYLISLYRERYGNEEAFEVIQPFSILSENMRPEVWSRLVKALWEIKWEEYQGVIITHGSDTLAYTSALMGMLFAHVPVPLVLTASNYPLGEKGSNGLVNFRSSVELIRTPGLKGVFTVYQNNKEKNLVYLATRITEAESYGDQFGAFGGVPFGRVEAGKLVRIEDPINPAITELSADRKPVAEECPAFTHKILMIRPYPGMDYGFVDLSRKPGAVLHCLYHSATACTEEEAYSLIEFLKRCKKENIPVYTCSYKNKEGLSYRTAQEILGEGAIPLMNISPEAAYAKLVLLYNLEEKGRQKTEESFYYEHLPVFC